MDVDEEEDEDEGNEIGPGCGILDFGIPHLKPSRHWIRKDYIRLYKYCDEYMTSSLDKDKHPSVVITGQSGIGKHFTL